MEDFIDAHCLRLKRWALLIIASILVLATTAAAAASDINIDQVVIVNEYGFGAPFLLSWLPIWVFSLAGGACAAFVKIKDLDDKFYFLHIAKVVLGVFGGVGMSLLVFDGEPPAPQLSFYAFVAGACSSPLLQGLLTIVSLLKNQVGLFNAVNPTSYKLEFPDDKEQDR